MAICLILVFTSFVISDVDANGHSVSGTVDAGETSVTLEGLGIILRDMESWEYTETSLAADGTYSFSDVSDGTYGIYILETDTELFRQIVVDGTSVTADLTLLSSNTMVQPNHQIGDFKYNLYTSGIADLSESADDIDTSKYQDFVVPDTVEYDGTTYAVCRMTSVPNLGETTLTLPFGLTSIGGNFLRSHTTLQSVTIPDTVTSIGSFAFRGCSGLTELHIPDTVTSIGLNAFNGCTGLTELHIPASVTELVMNDRGTNPFSGCTNLSSLTFGEGSCFSFNQDDGYVYRDGTQLFKLEGFTGEVDDPVAPPSTDGFHFDESSEVKMNDGLGYRTSSVEIDGMKYYGAQLVSLGIVSDEDAIIVPEYFSVDGLTYWVVEIGPGEESPVTIENPNVSQCQYSLIVSGNVKINDFAFYDWKQGLSLSPKDITFEKNVVSIGDSAFRKSNISTIDISGASSVGGMAFYDTPLSLIIFDENLTSIGREAFANSNLSGDLDLTGITLGSQSFYRTKLVKVTVSTDVPGSCFGSCNQLKEVVFTDDLTIADDAFSGTGITSLSGSEHITSVGDRAFFKGTFLWEDGSISLDLSNCTEIGDYGFAGMPITSLTLRDGSVIGEYAFSRTIFDSVAIPNDSAVGDFAFSNSGLKTVTSLPGIVPRSCFENCVDLVKVDFTNVTSVGNLAFSGCALTTLEIPVSVVSIGRSAFSLNTSLVSVEFENSLKTIPESLFDGCSSLTNVVWPKGLEMIETTAFRNTGVDISDVDFGLTSEQILAWASNAFLGSESIHFAEMCSIDGVSYGFSLLEVRASDYDGSILLMTSSSHPSSSESIADRYNEIIYTFPDNLVGIYSAAMSNPFFKVEVSDGNPSFSAYDGLLYTKDGSVLLKAYRFIESVALLPGVVEIGDSAFQFCNMLQSVAIPDSVRSIGDRAFSSCTQLSILVLNEGLESIGDGAFGYTSVTSVDLPSTLVSVGDGAFEDLESLNIPTTSRLESVGEQGLHGTYDTVYLPASLESIGESAFGTSLKTVYLGSVELSGLLSEANPFIDGRDHAIGTVFYIPLGQEPGDVLFSNLGGCTSGSFGGYFTDSDGAPQIADQVLAAGEFNIYIVSSVPVASMQISETGAQSQYAIILEFEGGFTHHDVVLDGVDAVWSEEDGAFILTVDSDQFITISERIPDNYHVITFDTDGGSYIPSLMVGDGRTVQEADRPIPQRESSEFLGWYDSDGNLYDWSTPVTGDITLTARWSAASPQVFFDTSRGPFVAEMNGEPFESGDRWVEGGVLTVHYQPYIGFQFQHWMVSSAGGSVTFDDEVLELRDITSDTTISVEALYSSPSSSVTGLINVDAPTSEDDLSILWEFGFEVDTSMTQWSGHSSVPLIVGDYVYVRISELIYKVDIEAGKAVKTAPSVNLRDYYHYLGYGNGVILDYPTGAVYDLDLNRLGTLPGDGYTSMVAEDGWNYVYRVDGDDSYIAKYNSDLSQMEWETELEWDVWGQYGTCSSILIHDGYIYYIYAEGDDRRLCSLDTATGAEKNSIRIDEISGLLMDDGWLTCCDDTLYFTCYSLGLMSPDKGDNIGYIVSVKVQDGEFGTPSFTETTNMANSAFIIFNGRGYVHSGSSFMVYDVDTMELIYSVRSAYSHGGIVVNTHNACAENNYEVQIYVIPYSPGLGLYIFTDREGQTSGDLTVKTGPAFQYNSQAVRATADGKLIWYNDTGHIFCVGIPDNNYTFVYESEFDGTDNSNYEVVQAEADGLEAAMEAAGLKGKYAYAFDETTGLFTLMTSDNIDLYPTARIFLVTDVCVPVEDLSADITLRLFDENGPMSMSISLSDLILNARDYVGYSFTDRPVHSVTYDANGGTVELPETTYHFAGDIVTVAPAPESEDFEGWMSSEGWSSVDGTFTMPDCDVVIYATWVSDDAESIEVSDDELELFVGETHTLVCTVTPAGAPYRWVSSDESVVTVSSDGALTPVSGGTATVAAITENGLRAVCEITVREHTSVVVIESEGMAFVGYELSLEAVLDGTESGVRWGLSDSGKASIVPGPDGMTATLLFTEPGTVTVFAYANDSGVRGAMAITAYDPSVPNESMTMQVGSETTLSLDGIPNTWDVSWTADDDGIVETDGQRIIAGTTPGVVTLVPEISGVTLPDGLDLSVTITVVGEEYVPIGGLSVSDTIIILEDSSKGVNITAYVDWDSEGSFTDYDRLSWTNSCKEVVNMTLDNNVATISPVDVGETYISVSADGLTQTCRVIVLDIGLSDITLGPGVSKDVQLISIPTIEGMEVSVSDGVYGNFTIEGGVISYTGTGQETPDNSVEVGIVVSVDGITKRLTSTLSISYDDDYEAPELRMSKASVNIVGIGRTTSINVQVVGSLDEVSALWSSDNEQVAVVEKTDYGMVIRSVGIGTTTITATYDGAIATCTVTVLPSGTTAPVLDDHNVVMSPGEGTMLTAQGLSSEAIWTSSDESVVTASNGWVEAVSIGTAVITVSIGNQSDSCTIVVTGVEYGEGESGVVEMTGPTYDLHPNIHPDDAVVTWASSDETVVVVDDGRLTAVSEGTAIVSCSVSDSTITYGVIVSEMPLTSITIPSIVTIDVGDTRVLDVALQPASAEGVSLTWTSSNTAVATVSDGRITAISPGTAVVTVVAADGSGVSATCVVRVSEVPVQSVEINRSALTLTVGGTQALRATVEPSDAANRAVVWSSSNPQVVSVSSTGVVTAIAPGTATITVTTVDGGYTDTCTVTVQGEVTSIVLDRTILSLNVSETFRITATTAPQEGATITWRSSVSNIASVSSDGTVRGVSPGTATITATCGDVSVTCTVTVYGDSEVVDKGTVDNPDGTKTSTTEETIDAGDSTVVKTTDTTTDADGNVVGTEVSITATTEGSGTRTTVTVSTDASGNSSAEAVTTVPATVTTSNGRQTITVSPADVMAAAEQIAFASASTGQDFVPSVVIDAGASPDAVSSTVTLTTEAITALASNEGTDVRIDAGVGSVQMSGGVVTAMSEIGEDVRIGIAQTFDSELTEAQRATAGGASVFSLTATAGAERIHELGGTATIRLPHSLDGGSAEDVRVYYMDDSGQLVEHACAYDEGTGTVEFQTTHFSYFLVSNGSLLGEGSGSASEDDGGISTLLTVAVGLLAVLIVMLGVNMYLQHVRGRS